MPAAWITNLQTRRDAICTELAALATNKAGGLPNTDGDGVNVDHVGYKDGLYRELRQIEETLTAAGEGSAFADGPGIFESEEYP